MSRADPPAPTWHASPALVATYAAGRAGPVDAASLEVHAAGCPLCRAELALALPDHDQALLAMVRERVTSAAPVARRESLLHPWPVMPTRLRIVVPAEALVAVLLAVSGAFLLDVLARHAGQGSVPSTGGGLLRLLAPVVPLAGVALCATRLGDPCREVVLASPATGLRLILWRTLSVLVVALPLTTVGALVLDVGSPAVWLLPCLALTVTTLAVGTLTDLSRAAGGVAGLWCLVAVGPALSGLGGVGDTGSVLARLTASRAPAVLATPGSQVAWALVAVLAAALLVSRRDRYSLLVAPVVRTPR